MAWTRVPHLSTTLHKCRNLIEWPKVAPVQENHLLLSRKAVGLWIKSLVIYTINICAEKLRFLLQMLFQLEVISLGKMSLSLQQLQYLLSEFFRQMEWPVRLDHLLSMTQNHSLAVPVTEEAELLSLLPKQPAFLSIWHSWTVKRPVASAEAFWRPVWQPGYWSILPFLVHTRFSKL